MKKLFSLVMLLTLVAVSNCTRVPDNNDPVIGIWVQEQINNSSDTEKESVRQEWIFNDVYLGRYHKYNGSNLEIKTDFSWEYADGFYTITYPGTDLEKQVVSMRETPEGTFLEDEKGNVLAFRE
ncbi:hypothetical protein PP178_12610 [Zeaxanthinibacter sp. PT1]|uniref:hypothetical protein n=1 Tax=Zeaxanthinibacter TaxID=561554 RepID=UPI0017F73039|nr:hypothetical protein [Zeaxanthinibacter sp. PT1]MDC6352396.1 hypothetical protein [Zeaxanthinibacter sp. PT1]NNF18532.1 hypothetical protein [Flavobacteriaceae bacterium]